MMYCENCHALFEGGEKCPECGKKKVRPVQDTDMCFLCEEEAMWGQLLMEVFKQEQVQFTYQQGREAWLGLLFGSKLNSYCFYVAYTDYERAADLRKAVLEAPTVEE